MSESTVPDTESRATRSGLGRSTNRRLRWVIIGLIAAGLVVATIGNQTRVQDWDPQYTRNLIERTNVYGGTYYENAIINKGPLEPLLYQIGSLMSHDGYWFAISGLSALLSLVLAFAAVRTARFAGATAPIAATVGVVAFIHFTFSDADYAGVVYVRNITVAMLAGCWVLAISDRAWTTARRRTVAIAAVSILCGLAIQSLLTTAFTGLVLLLTTLLLTRERAPSWERLVLGGYAVMLGSLAFISAPIWYWARGAFEEFWAGWHVHAQFMAAATGRSLGSQFGLGWDRFYAYHQERPLVFAVVVGFFAVIHFSWKSWTRSQRIVFAAVGAWWATAWIELVLSQRYSSHYFSVTAVPVTLMAALLAGLGFRTLSAARPRFGGNASWPVVAGFIAVFMFGPSSFGDALHATLGFRGVAAAAAHDDKYLDGNARTSRAILDLVTEDGDPLLGWTNDPWPYLKVDRVSATRFIWKSFFLGEIYLGSTSSQYVLPRTWEWFFEDLEESRPVALAEVNSAVAEGTPFASYVAESFTRVYSGRPMAISLRNDVAGSLLQSSADTPWIAPFPPGDTTGWSITGNSAAYSGGIADPATDLLPLTGSCVRIEGSVSWPTDQQAAVALYFEDTTGLTERLHLGIERGRAFSSSDFVMYEETPLSDDGSGTQTFTLVVGSRSAVLVMDDQIVGALRLPPSVKVSVQPRATGVVLGDLRVGAPPVGRGCP